MDIDEAWERFQKSEEPFAAFKKSSIDGKLDTIAAQLQEISTDFSRVTDIIPQMMGDKGALEADEQDPIDMVLGSESPDLSSLSQQMGAGEAPGGDMGEMPEEAPEEAPEESEETMEKAVGEEDMDDVREDAEEVDEEIQDDTPTEEMPEESESESESESEVAPDAPGETGMPSAEEETVEVSVTEETPEEEMSVSEESDVQPESEPPVEEIEPAGQEGIPPEGVPDLLDEINENQPDGLLNIYDRFIEGIKQAAHEMVESGRLGDVSNLAGAQNAIDSIWKSQVMPLTEPIMKSGDKMQQINSGKKDEDIASSHEVPLPSPDTEGEENTTGCQNAATEAPTDEGRTTAKAPHALNNDTTTVGSENPASFQKATPAEPAPDGQGMEPVQKALSDLEGAQDDYADPISDDSYTDPIRKSVPSFKEIMAESKEERFMKAAELRRGPHKSLEQFMRSWYGVEPDSEESEDQSGFAKSDMDRSMTAGEPMPGTSPMEGSMEKSCDTESMEKSEGAMTADTAGAVNPVYSDMEKSTAGQAGPSMSMEKSCDQLDDVNAAFEKSTGDTTPVDEELQGPVCEESADTGLADVETKMKKSMENGKSIPSLQDMMSFRRSMPYAPGRPSAIASANGDITRPDKDSFRKSAPVKPVVRMGYGVDPHKVVEKDLEEYRLYKTQRGY